MFIRDEELPLLKPCRLPKARGLAPRLYAGILVVMTSSPRARPSYAVRFPVAGTWGDPPRMARFSTTDHSHCLTWLLVDYPVTTDLVTCPSTTVTVLASARRLDHVVEIDHVHSE
jgi:hypothetical protein